MIATKFGFDLKGAIRPGALDSHPDTIRTSVHASLERLRMDTIDLLYGLDGVGRCQRRGGQVEVIHSDRVFLEPDEEHWYGAAPNRLMTHLAMLEVDEHGNSATWGEHVTDQEYNPSPTTD